jgi:hypothetical protein
LNGASLIGNAFRWEGRDRNFGGAFLYESKGAQDLRPRLGEEPSRALIGLRNGLKADGDQAGAVYILSGPRAERNIIRAGCGLTGTQPDRDQAAIGDRSPVQGAQQRQPEYSLVAPVQAGLA